MGIPRIAGPVQLICAVCYQDEEIRQQACDRLEQLWGPVAAQSAPYCFDHTAYYQKEMGERLFKFFIAFRNSIEPMQIITAKLTTNRIETELAQEGLRRVNLDPGYLEAAKLVLATTKNYSHRIYLGEGIYGDVQLFWRQGRFQSNPWTYSDYLESSNLEFFTMLRRTYLSEGKP